MTGFGSATHEVDGLTVTVELKTLNSKFLDIYCRIPKHYSDKEIELRNLLTQKLERGKVEFTLTINRLANTRPGVAVNRPLVEAYVTDFRETSVGLGLAVSDSDLFKLALQQPNAYNSESVAMPDTQAQDWELISTTVLEAIRKCDEFRRQEGNALEIKFREYIIAIRERLILVETQDVKRIPAVRERLRNMVTELLAGEEIDQNRFEQELIYYVEKFEISEEKVRLKNHLDYFLEVLSTEEANGKKLNFISQEIGREINTIGSKANDVVIQRLVVQMKDELEKIKEQTMNVI